MTAPASALLRRDGRKLAVEPAREVPITKLRTCLGLLYDWAVQDEEIDDVVDAVVGPESALLSPEELDEVLPRIRTQLRQLIHIATQRAGGAPSPELADLISRSQKLDAIPIPHDDFAAARGHARRLALLVGDVLELLAIEQEGPQAEGRWSG